MSGTALVFREEVARDGTWGKLLAMCVEEDRYNMGVRMAKSYLLGEEVLLLYRRHRSMRESNGLTLSRDEVCRAVRAKFLMSSDQFLNGLNLKSRWRR